MTRHPPAKPIPQAFADDDEAALFRAAVADARPLAPHGRVEPPRSRPAAIPRQFLRDEQEALRDSLSDAIDVDSLLETDASLSFRRHGIPPDTLRRLRRGHWVIQAEVDLHGLRSDEARVAIQQFVHAARAHDRRCVRVIHGKGLSSPGREPVLKRKVLGWLAQMDDVLAFCQARPCDGGAGALIVLLRSARR